MINILKPDSEIPLDIKTNLQNWDCPEAINFLSFHKTLKILRNNNNINDDISKSKTDELYEKTIKELPNNLVRIINLLELIMTEVSELTEELTISKTVQDTFGGTSEVCEVQGEGIKVQEQSENNGWGEESLPAGDGWGEVSSTIGSGWGENVAIEENTNVNNDYWGGGSSTENLDNLWAPEETIESFQDNSTTYGRESPQRNWDNFERNSSGGSDYRGYGQRDFSNGGGGYRYNYYSPEQSPKERKPGSLYESIHAPKRGSAPYVNENRVKSGGVSRRMDRMNETQLKDLMEKMIEEEEERFRKEEDERNKRDLEDYERQKMILQEEEEIRKRRELQKKKLQEETYMEHAGQKHNDNDDEQGNVTRNSSRGDGKRGRGRGRSERGASKRDDGGGSRRYSDQSKEFSSNLNEDKRFGDGNSWAEQQEQHIADNTGNIWNENNNENNELDSNNLENKEDCMKNASCDVEITKSNQQENYWDEGTETNHQDDYWGSDS
ncbi:7401_t:CDS:2 [Entrophospora sp. SA101]|nr:7401_t:CDS:2 [Entrophospora sp. SA101]